MTADKLHDAISLLPSDLIAETDNRRRAPRPVIHWQRYAAMAASLALVVCGSLWCMQLFRSGSAKKTAAEAPAAMDTQISMDVAEAAPMEEANIPVQDKEAAAGDNSKKADSTQKTNSTACYASVPAVTFYIGGIPYELAEKDRSTVAGLLLELDYRKDLVCECIAEITIVIGEQNYSLNLEERFIRGSEGQATLTPDQINILEEIFSSLIE